MDEFLDLKTIFFEEAAELLTSIETNLIALEDNPSDKKTLDQIFRDFHTLKGSSSLLDLKNITNLAHHLEDLLENIRNKKFKNKSDEPVDVLFKSLDLLKLLIDTAKEDKTDDNLDKLTEELIKVIEDLLESAKKTKKSAQKDISKLKSKPQQIGELLVDRGIINKKDLERALKKQKKQNIPLGQVLIDEGILSHEQLEQALEKQHSPTTAQTSIRVNIEKLDNLMDLVGEMVIANSLVMQNSKIKKIDDQNLSLNLYQLGKVVNDLQDQVMQLRMIPISHTFSRMNRLVRDTGKQLGKDVSLKLFGEDTEIDKNIVEDLNEILIHLVRNSIDHGIESPEERISAGKKPFGKLELIAYPKGGNIVIEVKDDGKGISKQKIVQKAKNLELIIDEENEAQIYQLIFETGFSTAEEVTNISGRGVGLDVVKKKLEEIRGKIEIASEEGKGTTFTITLQPTLAIIDGMVFRVGSERMIVPTLSIEESLRPTKEQVFTVEGSGEAVMIRGKIYPMIRLHNVFSINTNHTDPCEALVMVTMSRGRRCTILIDELIGQQQIVVKSLGNRFKKLKAISGGAILGDGSVGLILDLDGLMDCALENTA